MDGTNVLQMTHEGNSNDPQSGAQPLSRQRRWQKRNPEKAWAHRLLQSAVKRGVLVKPDRCSKCGTVGEVEAHHSDYSKPFDVVWFCKSCHKKEPSWIPPTETSEETSRLIAETSDYSYEASNDSSARKLAVMPKSKVEGKPKPRTRGTGHLYERGGMYWFELHYAGERFRQTLNVPVTGKKADKDEAIRRMDDAVHAIRSGEQPKKFTPVTIQAMFDTWILAVETNCKPRTIEDYKSRWTAHLEPVFGKLTATQVTLDTVTEYLNRRMKEGAGICTRNRENRVLQMIFGHNAEKIPADRMPRFPKMQPEKALVRKGRMSREDYAALQVKLDDRKLFWLKVLLTLTFKYGFRKSELLNAKVSYFNAKESTFTLPAFTTKNKVERVVDIMRDGEIFKKLVKLTEGRNSDDALFHRNGKGVKDYRGQWEKLTAGMTGGSGKDGRITIHDLRRSAITAMSEKGITAAQAGTHLTSDLFNRYISRNKAEKQATAAVIEG